MRDRIYTVWYMLLVTAVATAVLTGAKVALRDRIAINAKVIDHRAELYALGLLAPGDRPGAQKVDELHRARVREKNVADRRALLVLGEDGRTMVGVGLEFEGQSFWGPIRGIITFDPSGEKSLALYVLSQQETPGLGARILEPAWVAQFRDRPVAPDGEFWRATDAITGATRTSDSMKRILNQAVKDFQDLKDRVPAPE